MQKVILQAKENMEAACEVLEKQAWNVEPNTCKDITDAVFV